LNLPKSREPDARPSVALRIVVAARGQQIIFIAENMIT
jgi:hypothetical protein